MNCTECNSILSSTMNFCSSCGNRIADFRLQNSKPISIGKILLILVILVFIGGVASAGYFYLEVWKATHERLDAHRQEVVEIPDGPICDYPPDPQQEKDTVNPSSDNVNPLIIVRDSLHPVVIHRVLPKYPEEARAAGIQGDVILEAIVDKEGKVETVKILQSLHPLVDQASIDAIQKWRYKPVTLQGKTVKANVTITTTFTLHS